MSAVLIGPPYGPTTVITSFVYDSVSGSLTALTNTGSIPVFGVIIPSAATTAAAFLNLSDAQKRANFADTLSKLPNETTAPAGAPAVRTDGFLQVIPA